MLRFKRLYALGEADANEFNRVRGTAMLLHRLLESDQMDDAVDTAVGHCSSQYQHAISDEQQQHSRVTTVAKSGDSSSQRPVAEPFSTAGGLCLACTQ